MKNLSSKNSKRQSKTVPTECKICGAPAIYSYFGVISCQSCKIFFRRNAKRGQESLKCDFNNHCEINLNNRRGCSYCRLVKCLTKGMEIKMIRSSLPKTNKIIQTRLKVLVRLNEFEQFPTFNILRSDQSILTAEQWNLISNLSNCYDEHNGLLIGQCYMREQNLLPYKLRYKSISVMKLYQILLDGIILLYKNNRDFTSLSAYNRSILLHSTIKHTASVSVNFIMYQIRLLDQSAYYDAIGIITHPRVIPAAKRMAGRLDFDVIIIKLFLVILSFSTINFTVYSNIPPVNLSNIKEILHIQDRYIDLTWRYLLYRYDYKQAVKCFSELIRCFFAIHDGIHQTEDVLWYLDTMNSLVQKTEQSLILND